MAHTGAAGSDSTHTHGGETERASKREGAKERKKERKVGGGGATVTGDLREADMNLSPICFGSHGN